MTLPVKPHVVIYNAVSLDGRIEGFAADVALYYGQVARWHEDATLAGSDTLVNAPDAIPPETDADHAPPEARPDDHRPILAVADSRGRLRSWHYWRRQPYWRDHVALCSEATPRDYLDYLDERSVRYLVTGERHVDYARALEWLGVEYGVKTLRLESGGTLNGVLLRAGLVDEVALLVHPALVGGCSPNSFFRDPDPGSPAAAIPLKLESLEQLQDDILLLVYSVVAG